MMSLEQQIKDLSELSVAAGIIKRGKGSQFVPLKLALYPFTSSEQEYRLVQSVTRVWQKLIYQVSNDLQLLERVYRFVCCDDPMIRQLLKIIRKRSTLRPIFNFIRSDYFLDKNGAPKMIEYNLESVSMSSHSQNLQKVKQLTDQPNSHKYIQNKPNQSFIESISSMYRSEDKHGLFVFVVQENEVNIVEIRQIQMGLMGVNIKTVLIGLKDLPEMTRDENNDMRLGGEKVSVVYYRSGYKIQEYQGDWDALWKVREAIELSNAISIPDATMKLINSKRMQTELSKQAVYSQYLSKEEAEILSISLVRQWEFDSTTAEEFEVVMAAVAENKEGYVLKPNCEGGGNNLFGEEVYNMLKSVGVEERKKYILMEKIQTNPQENILLDGTSHETAVCDYEISNYGVVFGKGGDLRVNSKVGHLIRAKPTTANEGGIMSGVGSICAWMVEQQTAQ